nr:MAG TPA: hypothetical protein [Bacteriophage sp.]
MVLEEKEVKKMLLKDVSNVIGSSSYIVIYDRITYDNISLVESTNMLLVDEFKRLVEKSYVFANKSVKCLFAKDNKLCIGI